MAFSGRKVFQAGEVLTASDLNSIVDQTVMVFADSTARDTAIPSPVEGMVVFLLSDDSILKYDGSSWITIQADITSLTNRVTALEDNPTANLVTDSTTSRTITSSDAGSTIIFDSASDITITVNASTGFSAGERLDIIQEGTGIITITASTATVAGNAVSTTTGDFTMGDQYSAATLLCVGTDDYRLIGNITVVE